MSLPRGASAQDFTPYAYDAGSPTLTDYYIDPVNGSDQNSGLSAEAAWKTVQHAWGQVPQSASLTDGFRFNLMNGTYDTDNLPNYWELRSGSASHPIILRAGTGQTGVLFTRDINMANVSYFYLMGINITPSGGGDAFHCESCDHLLVRGCTLNGGSTSGGAHETLKINQSQYVYIENNNISNADDNNIDFVAVQYGHIIGNRVHAAQDWCAYVKGGSAYLRIEGNEFWNCGTGGFTVGQGSGFQFMTSPWLHYEAYDIKVINNVVHDAEGAAFGVNGGYNVLIAHNSAYRVGTRDHMLEIVFGERTCDGETDGAADSTCASNHTAGGWGSSTVDTSAEPIGNRNVKVLNNIFYNPSGVTAAQHFAIYGPRSPSAGMNLSDPQRSDTNLVISGNLIWNGTGSTPLGIEDSEQGCQDGNPTCSASQLLADNEINEVEPEFSDVSANDFRPRASGNLLSRLGSTLASFDGGDRESSPLAAQGNLSNLFTRDLSGASYDSGRIIGAFGSATATNSPPEIDEIQVPQDPAGSSGPTISRISVKVAKDGSFNQLTISTRLSGSGTVTVYGSVYRGERRLKRVRLKRSGQAYSGIARVKAPRRTALVIRVSATDSNGTSTSDKTVRAK